MVGNATITVVVWTVNENFLSGTNTVTLAPVTCHLGDF
jgi:hypothetical protein